MKLRIILRTSMNVHNRYLKRPFGLSNLNREEMVLKSAESLANSIEESGKEVFVEIVDDSSPKEFINKLEMVLKIHEVQYKIWRMKWKNSHLSLAFSYDLMALAKEELLFLCDDDYLFVPSAIKEIMEVYEDSVPGTNQFAVYPSDYPERYEKLYKSYIFLGRNRHWRSVGHTTGNIFITKPLFHKYRKIFDDFAVTFNEGTTINAIWAEVPAISPIPSLSAHLNDETMPPFVDWEKLL